MARVRNHLAFKRLRDLDQRHMVAMHEEKQLLELEQMKTDKLMLNILPRPIAERLKRGEKNISGSYAESTILFSDLVGFTELSSKISATELVKMLNDLFTRFDKRADSLGLEKIKTIGDAYMAAAGIPIPAQTMPSCAPTWRWACLRTWTTSTRPTAKAWACASASIPARWWPA